MMDKVTSWLGQSSWERRKAWAKQSSTWPAVEEEMPDAPQDTLKLQAPFSENGFLQAGSSSGTIESWLEECRVDPTRGEQYGIPPMTEGEDMVQELSSAGMTGIKCQHRPPRPHSSVDPFPEGIPAPLACGSCSNRNSFEDDLSLGAEAMLLLNKDRAEFGFPKGTTWPSQCINLDHSMASSALSGSTNKTSSSISEVLDLCEVDAETILCNLGFIQEEPQATSWIPGRFFAVPSQAKGIDFQLFLRAQVQRIEMEDPCLILASRFKQVQTLAVTADAFFCLYSYVSKTPVQKISPAHLFWAFPEIPDSWNAPSNPEALSPLQRLQRAVSRMCLYTLPQEGRLLGASDMQVPMSRLEQVVREVIAKTRKDRLDKAHTGTPGNPFSLPQMESASSKTTMAESTPAASPCFWCEASPQSREKTDLILPGLRPWLASCTSGTSRDGPDHDAYQELFHYSPLSPPAVSSPDESSEESDEESSGSTEESSAGKEDCVHTLTELV